MVFHKFSSTPHSFIMPGLKIRDDKVLSEIEAKQFYQFPIVVEEKPDGANVGISFNNNALVWIQNRENFVDPGGHHQFDILWEL